MKKFGMIVALLVGCSSPDYKSIKVGDTVTYKNYDWTVEKVIIDGYNEHTFLISDGNDTEMISWREL